MTAPHPVLGFAIIRRYLEVSREARERLKKAKSQDEKVKATIDFIAARYGMEEELNDGEQRARDIIDLIDSELPLDRESRRVIGKELQRLFFPEPLDRRRDHIREVSYDQKRRAVLKDYLQSWAGLPAGRAEEEVARYFGISVEALERRGKRARSEIDQCTADHLGIDIKALREQRRLAKRELRKIRGQPANSTFPREPDSVLLTLIADMAEMGRGE